ncbi:MAG TPA: LPS assembly lipoprotein LptE [Xanthomonadaceae bacterium]|nr:LPS assembly lipoprotein LptE [Xanthomonadaceae bacterium]
MTLRRISILLACICLLALAGCGFHPRGELEIPPNLGPVRVVASDPYSPLGDSLSRALTRAGAKPALATDTKVATLRIVSETWGGAALSVNAHAQVTEFYMTYAVKFSFTAADDTDVSALQEVKLQRDYTYDINHALGAAQEQGTLHDELQRDMAATILRRIGIAMRHYNP